MPTLVDLHGHYGFQNSRARDDVEGQLHARQSDRPSAAACLLGRRRGGRRRRSGRPLRSERRTHRTGATCRSNCATKSCRTRRCSTPRDPAWRIPLPARRAIRPGWTCPIGFRRRSRPARRFATTSSIKPEFIKIWVDDRDGKKTTLSPALYGAILDEAHRNNAPVAVHNVKLSDAEADDEGRHGRLAARARCADDDVVDDELIAHRARSHRDATTGR